MQTAEIRLECLKLAHRPDLSPADVTARADDYARWVGGGTDAPTTRQGPDDTPKEEKNQAPANRTSPSNSAKR